jgi:hypothetical protein
MRGYNRYFKDHLKDELQSIKGLGPVLFDVNRFIRMDELSLPARVNEYTFREILEVVEKLKAGELDEEVTINENGMIVDGALIYLAAKRLRRLKISFKIVPSNPLNQNGFSIIKNFN